MKNNNHQKKKKKRIITMMIMIIIVILLRLILYVNNLTELLAQIRFIHSSRGCNYAKKLSPEVRLLPC